MKKPMLCLLLASLLALPAVSLGETTFDGTVVASGCVSVTAPFGGTISKQSLIAGSRIKLGDPIATIETTKVFAPQDGTVTGVFGKLGDSTESVTSRYGAVLYIVPNSKYSISADIEKAYNSSQTKYVSIGETVYLRSTEDGANTAIGTITAAQGTGYTVETTQGELKMEETVYLYRSPDYAATSRIGRGTVSRTAEIKVSGTGSILAMHVKDGDTVKRGDILYETVTGSLDGLFATGSEILCDVSGIIASVDVKAGGVINKGDTLITVYPEDSLQIEISIDEYDLSTIKEGDTVDLSFNWDENKTSSVQGIVDMISHLSSSEGSEASYLGYIDFTPTKDVRLGMTVVVSTREGD